MLITANVLNDVPVSFEPRGTTQQDTIVFLIGLFPFVWATVEFWRRIAVGASFGTGKDSITFGDSNDEITTPGRRVLGKDALITAYVLFGIAAATLLLSVVSSLPYLSVDVDVAP